MESEELLSLLDSLELDEEIINIQLYKITALPTYTNRHLKDVTRFLKYKLAVNKLEEIDCNNDKEFDFVVKLIASVTLESIQFVCEITNMVLLLDSKSLVSKSEHLLQQILNDIKVPHAVVQDVTEVFDDPMDDEASKLLMNLKICTSIVEAVVSKEMKVSLLLLQIPLENVVFTSNDETFNYFMLSTIPKFTTAVLGFDILDRIWNCLKSTASKPTALKVLTALKTYYLPLPNETQHVKYYVVSATEFWECVHYGLHSDDPALRKSAIFLIKRALETLTSIKKDIKINTKDIVMIWDKKNEKELKAMWEKFFQLLSFLEQRQANIVLPALHLYESVTHIGHSWLNCIHDLGLKHSNALVRLHCIKYRLQIKISNKPEAISVLNALNYINLYEFRQDSKYLTTLVVKAIDNKKSLLSVLEAIPSVKWSAVPLYYMSVILSEVMCPSLMSVAKKKIICPIINDILRLPCNSPVLKKATYLNIAYFIVNTCKGFLWEDFGSIYPLMHSETPLTSYHMIPLASHIKRSLYLSDNDLSDFADMMVNCAENIEIGLLYVEAHQQKGLRNFNNIISDRFSRIAEVCSRPIANKTQCLPDCIFLLNILSKTINREEPYMISLNSSVLNRSKVIFQYLLYLLTTNVMFDVEDIVFLFDALRVLEINNVELKDILLELYKTCCGLAEGNDCTFDKKTFAISIINYLCTNSTMTKYNGSEMLTLEQFLELVQDINKNKSSAGSGKLIDAMYEKLCEIVVSYSGQVNPKDSRALLSFVADVLECGGYGCLKHNLRIINKNLSALVGNGNNFDVSQVTKRLWSQICELKSSKELVACVKEFTKLITQDLLLKSPEHNPVLLEHCKLITDLANNNRKIPLYHLVKNLSTRNVMEYDNMLGVVSDILLYVVVPKKEQRITENLTLDLEIDKKNIVAPETTILSQHIQLQSIIMLSKVRNADHLNAISDKIMSDIDQILAKKPHYYPNDTTYRKLVRAIQNLLYIILMSRQVDVQRTALWCLDHLKNAKNNTLTTYFTWYFALYLYIKNIPINADTILELNNKEIHVNNQMKILYFVIIHKVRMGVHHQSESEFVLDFLLGQTMGSSFTTRLMGQYYAKLLFDMGIQRKVNAERYSSVIEIVTETLQEYRRRKEPRFIKVREDYFSYKFDIVRDLTPTFIYHNLQRLCDQVNENVDTVFAERVFKDNKASLLTKRYDAFYIEWDGKERWHALQQYQPLPTVQQEELKEGVSTLQKKYTPASSNTDSSFLQLERTAQPSSELIVVASLVDRPPNLGGLARTCEVFGVSAYVIAKLAVVDDPSFQSVCMTADRWVNMQEVPKGQPLIDYLQSMKSIGYTVVAAEQTTKSTILDQFKFPKKTVIILGNEKDGIPPDLMMHMDKFVEIPQKGVIRSLNVHVTGAIMIWEYARQVYSNIEPFSPSFKPC